MKIKNILTLVISCLLIVSCAVKKPKQVESEVIEVEEVIPVKKTPVLTYEVQIGAFDIESSALKAVENVKVIFEESLYKYRLGSFTNYRKARKYRKSLLNKYPDAFVQALLDGKPITIEEAIK
jgi:N-acetylmuramoyl-L-alanine amidase